VKLNKKYKVRGKGTIATNENGDTLFVMDPEEGVDYLTAWILPPWDNPFGILKDEVEWT